MSRRRLLRRDSYLIRFDAAPHWLTMLFIVGNGVDVVAAQLPVGHGCAVFRIKGFHCGDDDFSVGIGNHDNPQVGLAGLAGCR